MHDGTVPLQKFPPFLPCSKMIMMVLMRKQQQQTERRATERRCIPKSRLLVSYSCAALQRYELVQT